MAAGMSLAHGQRRKCDTLFSVHVYRPSTHVFLFFLILSFWVGLGGPSQLLSCSGTSVACAVGPSVTTSSTDFFASKTWFLGIYLNFQRQNPL
jgi:hypothetical protein